MAQVNRISLMHEFEKVLDDNDYVMLTTYAFDPFFFDGFLLKELERNNVGAEIAVLVDSNRYLESYPRFTSLTGRNYRLVPIFLNQGVFHPKVFLFFSLKKQKATLYIGSSNLTLSGFTNNAELVAKFQYDLKIGIGEIFMSVLDMFSLLLSKGVLKDVNLANLIADVRESHVLKGISVMKEDCVFAHNLELPILYQMKPLIGGKKFDSLLILAPFISDSSAVLKELLADIRVSKIMLCLQAGNHNLASISAIENFCRDNNIQLEVCEASLKNPEEENRLFHSKILYFRGNQDFLLVGSPNFTIKALLRTVTDGNIECALLYNGERCREIISEIDVKSVQDVNRLLRTGFNVEYENLDSRVKLFSAYFDSKNLILETEPKDIDADVLVNVEQPTKMLTSRHNLASGQIQIPIEEGTPIEAVVSVEGRGTPIRIFHDKNYIIRKIRRASSTPVEVSEILFQGSNLDGTDMITLMSGLVNSVASRDASSHKKSEHTREKPGVYKPAKEGQIGSMSGMLKTLAQVYHMLSISRTIARIEDNLREETEEQPPPKPANPKYEEAAERSKLVKRIVKSFNTVLQLWARNHGNDPDSSISSQNILLHFYLKLFRQISSDDDVLNLIREKLEKNLNDARLSESSKESKTKLFAYLVTFYYTCRLQQSLSFISTIFRYEDVISKDTYSKARDLSETIFSALGDVGFDGRTFAWWYSKLARDCLTSADVEEKMFQLCVEIDKQENDEYQDMLIQFLRNLKNKWSISDYIRKGIATLNFEKPSTVLLIENILGPIKSEL